MKRQNWVPSNSMGQFSKQPVLQGNNGCYLSFLPVSCSVSTSFPDSI